MSNDRQQIEIERAFRKLGYVYLRKRQTKGDARKSVGGSGYVVIKKVELAQAVAACDLDPALLRQGKEGLFEEDLYTTIFPNANPDYYLPRYWMLRAVTYWVSGDRRRTHTKWLVLHFMWLRLASLVRSPKNARAFREMSERRRWELNEPLFKAIDRTIVLALKFFKAKRGAERDAFDLSSFFRIRGRAREFNVFWSGPQNKTRGYFNKLMIQISGAIEEWNE